MKEDSEKIPEISSISVPIEHVFVLFSVFNWTDKILWLKKSSISFGICISDLIRLSKKNDGKKHFEKIVMWWKAYKLIVDCYRL